MKPTPYDTGKVKIGCRYDPWRNYHNPDQNWIRALIRRGWYE